MLLINTYMYIYIVTRTTEWNENCFLNTNDESYSEQLIRECFITRFSG